MWPATSDVRRTLPGILDSDVDPRQAWDPNQIREMHYFFVDDVRVQSAIREW